MLSLYNHLAKCTDLDGRRHLKKRMNCDKSPKWLDSWRTVIPKELFGDLRLKLKYLPSRGEDMLSVQ